MIAKKPLLINIFLLHLKKASLQGMYHTEAPQRKGSYYLGKDVVLQLHFWEKDIVTYVFLAQIFKDLAFKAPTSSILASFIYQQRCSTLVTHAVVSKVVSDEVVHFTILLFFFFSFSWGNR